jgi:ribosomal protein S20
MRPGSTDIPSMIEKLDSLRKRGILSEDEFQRKKAELLAKL